MKRTASVLLDPDDMESLMVEIQREVKETKLGIGHDHYWTWVMVQIVHEVGMGIPFGDDICDVIISDINEVVYEALKDDPTADRDIEAVSTAIKKTVERLMDKPGTIAVYRHITELFSDYSVRCMSVISTSYERYMLEIEIELEDD